MYLRKVILSSGISSGLSYGRNVPTILLGHYGKDVPSHITI